MDSFFQKNKEIYRKCLDIYLPVAAKTQINSEVLEAF